MCLGWSSRTWPSASTGVPEVDTSWHHTGSAVIDPAFLKAVEVESGAASADAGFGAAAGAVRYETVSAQDMLMAGQNVGGRARLSYGSNGQGASASLASYGIADGFDWLVMLHKQDGDDYEDGDGNTILGTAPATAGVLAKLGYEFETHRLELAYQRDQDHADRTIKMNLGLADDTTLYPMDVTTDRLSLTYTSTAPTAAWDPKVQFYVSSFDYDRPDYVEDGANGDMRLEEEQFGGKAENRFELGSGTITAGVDFNQHDYRVDSYGDNPTRNFQTTQLGTYVQGRFEFGNGFDLSTGARADYMRYTDWNNERFSDAGLSANATLSYEFRPGFEVFAGASRTFMGYDLAEYGYLHARADGFVTDPDFEASSARNVKVGFNADTGPWQFGVTYFDTHIDDMPEYGWTDLVLTNAYDRRSEGYTLNAAYSWGAGRAGMTFTDVKTTENGEETLPSSGSFVPVGKTATLFVDQEFAQYDLKVGGSIAWPAAWTGTTGAPSTRWIPIPSWTPMPNGSPSDCTARRCAWASRTCSTRPISSVRAMPPTRLAAGSIRSMRQVGPSPSRPRSTSDQGFAPSRDRDGAKLFAFVLRPRSSSGGVGGRVVRPRSFRQTACSAEFAWRCCTSR